MKRSLLISLGLLVVAGVAWGQEAPFGMEGTESIAGSTVSWVSGTYDTGGGTTSTICFSAANTSADTEWLSGVTVTFPATWVAACNSQDAADSGGNAVAFDCVAATNSVSYTDNDGGYGEVYDGETWGFCVDVTPPAGSWPAPQVVSWDIVGDGWGGEPHTAAGATDIVPVELMSFSIE